MILDMMKDVQINSVLAVITQIFASISLSSLEYFIVDSPHSDYRLEIYF
jgi:hypothetical protein